MGSALNFSELGTSRPLSRSRRRSEKQRTDPEYGIRKATVRRDRISGVVGLPLVFVTSRAEKAREAERLGFVVERLDLDLAEPQALDPSRIVEEKAKTAYAMLSRPVLVEDSGLSIEAWGGFPGALVKWLERSAGIAAIPRMLDAFPDRSATASCAIAYTDGGDVVSARGEARGSIAPSPRGSNGFGWDTIFVPEGETRTFAEMSGTEKDRLSHRRRAWDALAARLPLQMRP
jgi:XTP/dITP diphosphohydrolase